MKHLIRLFIYGNTACADRRPTTVDDWEDYYEKDVEVETPTELLKALDQEVLGYEDEDVEDVDAQGLDFEGVAKEFDSVQDYGDGSAICYAIYDLTDNKWLLGDENSKKEWLTEYVDEEEYDEEGLDFAAISKMDITK